MGFLYSLYRCHLDGGGKFSLAKNGTETWKFSNLTDLENFLNSCHDSDTFFDYIPLSKRMKVMRNATTIKVF